MEPKFTYTIFRKRLKEFENHQRIERNLMERTIKDYSAELEKFAKFCSEHYIENPANVKTDSIRKYLEPSSRLEAASIAKKIAILRSFFKFLLRSGHIKRDPMLPIPSPKRHRSLPEYLIESEMRRLLEAVSTAPARFWGQRERDTAMVCTLAYAGLRRSELLNLNWEDINPEGKLIRVRNGKGGEDRVVPIHISLAEAIAEYKQHLEQRYGQATGAFLKGKQGKRLSEKVFRDVFKKHVQRVGFEKRVTPHTLRHAFASLLLEIGVDIAHIKELLGHKDISTTQIYLHATAKGLNDAIQRLPEF